MGTGLRGWAWCGVKVVELSWLHIKGLIGATGVSSIRGLHGNGRRTAVALFGYVHFLHSLQAVAAIRTGDLWIFVRPDHQSCVGVYVKPSSRNCSKRALMWFSRFWEGVHPKSFLKHPVFILFDDPGFKDFKQMLHFLKNISMAGGCLMTIGAVLPQICQWGPMKHGSRSWFCLNSMEKEHNFFRSNSHWICFLGLGLGWKPMAGS